MTFEQYKNEVDTMGLGEGLMFSEQVLMPIILAILLITLVGILRPIFSKKEITRTRIFLFSFLMLFCGIALIGHYNQKNLLVEMNNDRPKNVVLKRIERKNGSD